MGTRLNQQMLPDIYSSWAVGLVVYNRSLVVFTDTTGKICIYRYAGSTPYTITGTSPSLDAGISDTAWVLVCVSNATDWLESSLSSSDGYGLLGKVSSVSALSSLSTSLTRVMVKGSSGGEFELLQGSYTADGGDIFPSAYSGKYWSRVRRVPNVKSSVEYGAYTDRSTDSTDSINSMLSSMSNGVAIIDSNVVYKVASLTIPSGVTLIINSTWDGATWTAPIRVLSASSDGFSVSSNSNASLVLDNLAGIPYSKISYRLNGSVAWVSGMDDSSSQDYQIKQGSLVKYRVSKSGDQHGWNKDSLTSGVDYERGKRDSSNLVSRTTSPGTGYSISEQYYHGSTLSSEVIRTSDGKIQVKQLGVASLLIDTKGQIVGSPKKIYTVVASFNLLASQTGSVITNDGSTTAITATLPSATPGLQFTLLVNAAFNFIAKCSGTDTIRTSKSQASCSDVGGMCRLTCVVSGVWEIESVVGTWVS